MKELNTRGAEESRKVHKEAEGSKEAREVSPVQNSVSEKAKRVYQSI